MQQRPGSYLMHEIKQTNKQKKKTDLLLLKLICCVSDLRCPEPTYLEKLLVEFSSVKSLPIVDIVSSSESSESSQSISPRYFSLKTGKERY